MLNQLDVLMLKFDELERLLKRYVELTNQLCSVDIEEIADTDRIISEREVLIDDMKIVNPEIMALVNTQDEKDKTALIQMLNGGNSYGRKSEELSSVQSRILNIKSLQGEIIQKDRINHVRFEAKYNSVKSSLMELKEDKKKIDFYNSSKISGKGIELNSNG